MLKWNEDKIQQNASASIWFIYNEIVQNEKITNKIVYASQQIS